MPCCSSQNLRKKGRPDPGQLDRQDNEMKNEHGTKNLYGYIYECCMKGFRDIPGFDNKNAHFRTP